MDSKPKVMVLGALSTTPGAKKEPAFLPKNKEVLEGLNKHLSGLGTRERKRSEVLQKTHRIMLHISKDLEDVHEKLRERNKEVFGLIHYGHLIHVGISRLRSMTIKERLALINACTMPKTAGRQAVLLMTRGCFLDYQLFWIQVREELWTADLTQVFGMPELMRMIEIVTRDLSPDTLRREYVRISTSKLN